MKIVHKVDYSARRAEEYPSIESQLDMFWHAMNSGQLPKVEPFYSAIKQVKDRFPKTTQQ